MLRFRSGFRSYVLLLHIFIFLLLLSRGHGVNNSSIANITTQKPILNIGALLSRSANTDSYGYGRSVSLGKALIENNTRFKTLTDRYQLKFVIKDPQGIAGYAIERAYLITQSKPNPIAVIGPAFSNLLDYVAMTVSRISCLLVPYTTKMVEDPEKTQFVMSASSGISQEIAARMEFMKKFKWKRAAVIYDKRNQYLVTFADKMFDQLKKSRVNLTGSAAIEIRVSNAYIDDPIDLIRTKLLNIKIRALDLSSVRINDVLLESSRNLDRFRLGRADTKIYFAEIDPYSALVLFCQVYLLDMYGPDIVWIVNSQAYDVPRWLDFNNSRNGQIISCSKEQIRLAAKGAFIFERQVIREDSNRTDSGMTADEYIGKLVAIAKRGQSNLTSMLTYSSFSFDALWAVAIALNNSIKTLDALNRTFESRNANEIVQKEMKQVEFEGIGGPYSYSNASSTRDGTISIFQFRNDKKVRIGLHVKRTNQLTFFNATSSLWENGDAPKDSSTVKLVVLTIESGLYLTVSTAASIGILLGILFLTFNLVYGKYRFIKLSAPLFNNIIAGGCIMCLTSIFLFGVHDISNPETNFALVCKARAWTLTIGFSCAFGAMFVKTWRIYKICTNKKLRVKLGPLSDWYLLSLVGIIVVMDLIILITWELSDPIQHKAEIIHAKRKEPGQTFVLYTDIIRTCYAENMIVWLTVIYVYKGILILYGLFLAYETRNVIYAHLNDSRVIGICVYNVVVLSVVGAFLSLLLEYKNYKEMYIVLSVCIIFPAVATICLIMFPKVAYRCKTNNLDDTETIANGMTTVRGSFDVASTCHQVNPPAPQPPPPRVENTLKTTTTTKFAVQFSYQNGIDELPSESPASSSHLSETQVDIHQNVGTRASLHGMELAN